MNFRHATLALSPLLFVLALSCAQAEALVPRPNILFLLSDDQRADTIAAMGNAHVATPNLDRLAAEGTSFSRAYCMGALQGAVQGNLEGQTTWPEQFFAAVIAPSSRASGTMAPLRCSECSRKGKPSSSAE